LNQPGYEPGIDHPGHTVTESSALTQSAINLTQEYPTIFGYKAPVCEMGLEPKSGSFIFVIRPYIRYLVYRGLTVPQPKTMLALPVLQSYPVGGGYPICARATAYMTTQRFDTTVSHIPVTNGEET
jgi:hypothetical protein